ncbi:MAG TPA: hypothetical protein VK853_04405 [Ilumatobacteraceae bacterium]|nr:hypothetical protein [Ilumatobacteraceae bacterium]
MRGQCSVGKTGAVIVTAIVTVIVAASACSGSSEPTGPPSLDRIDGPAVVDPSFDPFATIPPSTDVGG